jgi:hypothetical protein
MKIKYSKNDEFKNAVDLLSSIVKYDESNKHWLTQSGRQVQLEERQHAESIVAQHYIQQMEDK